MYMQLILTIILLLIFPKVVFADITSNLVAWYQLDEGTGSTANDSSGNGNSGTETGSPSYVFGFIGPYALSFNGSTQWISKSSPSALPTGDLTYAAWIYNTSTSGSHTVICLGNNSSTNRNDIYIEVNPSSLDAFQFINGTFASTTSSITVINNVWQHVAAVFHVATGNVDFYSNGVFLNTQTLTAALPSVNGISVGAFTDDNGSFLNQFLGNIDDARIYSRALNASDVLQLYNFNKKIFINGNAKINNASFGI